MGLVVTEKSMIGLTVGTLLVMITGVWVASGQIHELKTDYDQRIEQNATDVRILNLTASTNTEAIERIELTLKVNQLRSELAANSTELRSLRRELRKDSTNELLISQIEKIEYDSARIKATLECLLDGLGVLCE